MTRSEIDWDTWEAQIFPAQQDLTVNWALITVLAASLAFWAGIIALGWILVS